MSALGKEFRYVPLETTDSSIITISAVTTLAVTDRLILVGARNVPLKAFDKQTGRYLGQIGQIGNGPTEYPNARNFQTDPVNGHIYVKVTPTRYQQYDSQGNYSGSVGWDESARGMLITPYFLGDKLYNYVNIPTDQTTALAYSYELRTGDRCDSLPLRWGKEVPAGKCKLVLPVIGSEVLGGMALFVQFENDRWTYGFQNKTPYWYSNGRLRLKDFYCDTIFTVNGFDRLQPQVIFDMGNYGGFDRYEKSETMTGKFIITRILETGNVIYFNLMKNMYDIDHWIKGAPNPPYCGVYDKKTGVTRIMKKLAIDNDQVEKLPGFIVYDVSDAGELVVCYQTEDLMEAREKMPETVRPAWLKQLKEDDNPVILLIK